MDAAYNLARWLMRNNDEAADAVQDAFVRALRFIGGYRGGDARVWLLAIVRNTCYSRLQRGKARALKSEFDDELHSPEPETANLNFYSSAAVIMRLCRRRWKICPRNSVKLSCCVSFKGWLTRKSPMWWMCRSAR
jgi:DNA-directed RNA polymerase specialized sigma24 family protein